MSDQHLSIACTVNGTPHRSEVEARLLLSDYLRHDLGLTGTHVGCEHGVCGACTVLLDGRSVRSCLVLAGQVDGSEITTVEALAAPGAPLNKMQEAFRDEHGLQCGFCTPGILMSLTALSQEEPRPTTGQIDEVLGGHLCRCTGYRNIRRAAEKALR
jgi:aerobic carbon-monoxide dehydrogenase small subunit